MPPDRAQADDGPQRRAPDVGADQRDGLVGRARRVLAGERELPSDQQVAAGVLGGQLRGPPLTLAMAQAHAPPRQPEVLGVEVDGLEALGIARDREDVVAELVQRRHPERGRRGELHLALQGRRHLARPLRQLLQVRVRLQPAHGRHALPALGSELPREHIVVQVHLQDLVQPLPSGSRSITSVTHSTRWSRLRGIRSADPMNIRGPRARCRTGRSANARGTARRWSARGCSRTCRGTPGRRQQMPRTIRSISVPARDASYSASIISASTRLFIFITMRPSGAFASLSDHLEDPRPQADRRDQDPPVRLLVAVPGQVVEEVRHVGRDVGVVGQQTDVLVERRRHRVVVPGADVAVLADLAGLLADDERALRVGLQPDHAVHDVDAGLLEHPCPRDVGLLVEPRGQLDQRHGLLAGLGGAHQRAHDAAVLARRPVQGLLDRQHRRVASTACDTNCSTDVENASYG